jgi:hypothetical protein
MAALGKGKETAKINKSELEDLMKFYLSEDEVMDWFDIKVQTLRRYIKKEFGCTFDSLREKSFVRTRVAIKRAQIKKALSGDNTMLIWCGKQYLGQVERTEIHLGKVPDDMLRAEVEKRVNAAKASSPV